VIGRFDVASYIETSTYVNVITDISCDMQKMLTKVAKHKFCLICF